MGQFMGLIDNDGKGDRRLSIRIQAVQLAGEGKRSAARSLIGCNGYNGDLSTQRIRQDYRRCLGLAMIGDCESIDRCLAVGNTQAPNQLF
jgi:hypothetical protein